MLDAHNVTTPRDYVLLGCAGVVTSCLVNMARKKMKNQNKIMKLTDKKKNKLLKKNVLIQLSFEDFLFKKL